MDDQLKMHAADMLGAQENRYQPTRDQEIVNTLREAGYEIEHLRATVAELSPDARFGRTFTKLIDLLSAGNEPTRAYGVDTVWRIKSLVEELEIPMRAKRETEDEALGRYGRTMAERDIRKEDPERYAPGGPQDFNAAERDHGNQDFGEERDDAHTLANARNKLAGVLSVATDPGNAFANDYMLGMANGLLLAQSIVLDQPSNVKVPFLKMPEKPDPTAVPADLEPTLSERVASGDAQSVQELLDQSGLFVPLPGTNCDADRGPSSL